jgi:hypothetical protein
MSEPTPKIPIELPPAFILDETKKEKPLVIKKEKLEDRKSTSGSPRCKRYFH